MRDTRYQKTTWRVAHTNIQGANSRRALHQSRPEPCCARSQLFRRSLKLSPSWIYSLLYQFHTGPAPWQLSRCTAEDGWPVPAEDLGSARAHLSLTRQEKSLDKPFTTRRLGTFQVQISMIPNLGKHRSRPHPWKRITCNHRMAHFMFSSTLNDYT